MILRWITPGDIFGGAALVSRPSNYILSTEAVRDSTVLSWDGPTIRALARRLALLLENAIYLAADYFSWYAAAHAVMTFQTASERLAHVLVNLAPSLGQRASEGGIELDVTIDDEMAAVRCDPQTAR